MSHGLLLRVWLLGWHPNTKGGALWKGNERGSFTGVLYSWDSLDGPSPYPWTGTHKAYGHLWDFKRPWGGVGETGSFHNSFQSLNTLTSGNSSLYLTHSPPPAVNTHFRFLLSSVRMENSCPASSVRRPLPVTVFCSLGLPSPPPASLIQIEDVFFACLCLISVCSSWL